MKKLRVFSILTCFLGSLVVTACGANVETTAPRQTAVQAPSQQPTQPSATPETQTTDQSAVRSLPFGIVYSVKGMEKAQLKADMVYKTLPNGDSFKMDVYLPEEARKSQKYPAVIFVHGRARNPVNLKDRDNYVSWGQLVTKSGLAGVTFNYRITTYDKTAESYEDIKDLIQYVRSNADSLQIDKDRLAIMTFSASGVPGLYLPLKERPPYIKAMVSYYNWLDLEQMRALSDPAYFEKINQYAPLTLLKVEPEKIAPMLIVKAAKDGKELNDTIDLFMKTAKEKHAKVELLVHPEGDHGFDFENDDDTSRAIIQQTVAFLAKHLLKN